MEVLEFSAKYLGRKNIHVNTGTHGDQYGETIAGEIKFAIQDIKTALKHPDTRVSVHIVSDYAGPIYPGDVSCDIIDAWCYSAHHHGYLQVKEEEKTTEETLKKLLEQMTLKQPDT